MNCNHLCLYCIGVYFRQTTLCPGFPSRYKEVGQNKLSHHSHSKLHFIAFSPHITLQFSHMCIQSCLIFCDPMDCSRPGSSAHGILQAGILEWQLFPSLGDLPDPGIKLTSLASPGVAGVDSLLLHHLGNPSSLVTKCSYQHLSQPLQPGGSAGKESTCNVGDLGPIPRLGRSPEKGKATHSTILAWRIPWTIWSMGLHRVGHD